ncbi:Helix-turn-helix domain [Mycobacteroides abscessus subsp. bolletii]|nr:Helix-turn-helix domain [Mycobacteroides abscessus subsp. bolletii]SHT09021.1 Helix-turn-helix domain [Mycobacteroides abscessus subsp. bolletii]SHT12651.1 Helix-turn-helix domain [Mycobacteroides abscessus subsp. bolletii]SHZ15235.1 Helix-turn-helix domain [Mycobacteroides abscessus subsp. bolletii]SHZ22682.1 Helix-turn-helix domain [Mycobacteroides abscessus subsp. bolletii]
MAQRLYAKYRRSTGWAVTNELVDEMIAAANSIPEGAPVGTIARRPDGRWIGVRDDRRRDARGLVVRWLYAPLHESAADWPANDDADSWPQIRPDQWHDQSGLNWFPPGEEPLVPRPDPTDREPSREELREYFHKDLAEYCQSDDPDEYHEGDKPRLERLMREPSVFDREAVPMTKKYGEMFRVILETLDSVVEFYGVDAPYLALQVHNALRAAGYDADPTAQQEPERFPGIENPTTADHVGADNADEQLKLIFALQCIRVERGLSVADIGEALGLEDSEVERFESGSTNPTMSMIRRYARAVEAVFTVDVRKWEDTPAQQEPATTHPVSPESTNCVPKPRTPRVVDRLGVDEQGSRWRDTDGDEYFFEDQEWMIDRVSAHGPGGLVREATDDNLWFSGPYTEVLGDPL